MDENVPEIDCPECGSTNYYKEAGHYYCSECQTQSQQVQHVFEQEVQTTAKKSTKKIKKDSKDKQAHKVTSWECYNIILRGLTQELIDIGVDSNLKFVVKCLWMKYLNKIEVLELKSNAPPKFQLRNSRRDVKILYGTKRKRYRKRSSSESGSASTSNVSMSKRDMSRKKRALAQSQQDTLSQKSTQDTSSLHNETLTSLRSGESDKDNDNQRIHYNSFSHRQIRKKMSRQHMKRHQFDIDFTLKCHPLSREQFGSSVFRDPSNLNFTQIYNILYIALLIMKDPIHLGDMLRFIREGHLSFGHYYHLLPKEFNSKHSNVPFANFSGFRSKPLRQSATSLINYLDVGDYIVMPNLVEMSERYCRELNLPDAIYQCVKKLILLTTPRMKLSKKSTAVPNYEARVMTLIVFVMKLLFGLDGVTEQVFSNYANMLNDVSPNIRAFDIMKWLKYIGYRNVVMSNYHFPTSFEQNGDKVDNSELFLNYIEAQNINLELRTAQQMKLPSDIKDYLEVLQEISESTHNDDDGKIQFKASTTPFRTHLDTILNHQRLDNSELLKYDFTNDCINYILRPNKYLELVNNEVVINAGANDNIQFTEAQDVRTDYSMKSQEKNKAVEITVGRKDNLLEYMKWDAPKVQRGKKRKKKLEQDDNPVTDILAKWRELRAHLFELNKLKTDNASTIVKLDLNASDKVYSEHYNPFERYWMNTHAYISRLSQADGDNYLATLPHSFNLLINECVRIIEQSKIEFIEEYHLTEMYLVYVETFGRKANMNCAHQQVNLKNFLKTAKKVW